jgi:FtsZ-binding cell division protein ZapB
MSEERFDRLEVQLAQLIQAVSTMQQNMGTMQQDIGTIQQNMGVIQQNMGAMNQNIDALREDVVALRHRIDSVEGSQQIIIREGFQSLMSYNDDLNYELSDTARQTRLLKRRVIRLERKEKED